MKLSVRNLLSGTVTEVRMGGTTSHVKIRPEGGAVVTAFVTNEAGALGVPWGQP